MSDDPPVLDPETVAALRELQLLGRLYGAFVQGLPAQLASLRRARATGDRPELRAVAHRLRGAAGQLGAGALSRAVGVLEDAVARGADDRLWPTDADIEALARTTAAAMARELAGVEAAPKARSSGAGELKLAGHVGGPEPA